MFNTLHILLSFLFLFFESYYVFSSSGSLDSFNALSLSLIFHSMNMICMPRFKLLLVSFLILLGIHWVSGYVVWCLLLTLESSWSLSVKIFLLYFVSPSLHILTMCTYVFSYCLIVFGCSLFFSFCPYFSLILLWEISIVLYSSLLILSLAVYSMNVPIKGILYFFKCFDF